MLRHVYIWALILPALLFAGCKTQEIPPATFGDQATEPLIADKSISATNIGGTRLTLAWQKATRNGVEDPNLEYQVYLSTQGNIETLSTVLANGTAYGTSQEDISSLTVSGLTVSTKYYFNVLVKNSADNKAAYRMAAYTTLAEQPVDPSALPKNKAAGLLFTDLDLDPKEISGDLTIQIATDESDVTHYHLYWGSDGATKLAGEPAISKIAKTGSNLIYGFNPNTPIPSGATDLLVFTANAEGEMTSGVNLTLADRAAPQATSAGISFNDQDADPNQIQGPVNIAKAADRKSVV